MTCKKFIPFLLFSLTSCTSIKLPKIGDQTLKGIKPEVQAQLIQHGKEDYPHYTSISLYGEKYSKQSDYHYDVTFGFKVDNEKQPKESASFTFDVTDGKYTNLFITYKGA